MPPQHLQLPTFLPHRLAPLPHSGWTNYPYLLQRPLFPLPVSPLTPPLFLALASLATPCLLLQEALPRLSTQLCPARLHLQSVSSGKCLTCPHHAGGSPGTQTPPPIRSPHSSEVEGCSVTVLVEGARLVPVAGAPAWGEVQRQPPGASDEVRVLATSPGP